MITLGENTSFNLLNNIFNLKIKTKTNPHVKNVYFQQRYLSEYDSENVN